MFGEKIVITLNILVLVLVIAGVIGWFKNIFALTNCDFEAPYKCEVVHTVGIIPPIGAIVGWIDVGK